MKNTLSLLVLAITSLAVAPCAPSAPAAEEPPNQIFVSAMGKDGRPGSRLRPKRTFQAAHDAVAAGGQILALDTAEYGPMNITKSVNVAAVPGASALITASSGNGILIGNGLRVTLRGLAISAAAPDLLAGIRVEGVSSLQIQNCKISGFGTAGNLTSTGGLVINTSGVVGSVVLSDTVIRDCFGSGISHGVIGNPTNSSLLLDQCQLLSNGQGLLAGSSGRVTVRNSIISNNTTAGISGGGFVASDVRVNVEHCAVTDNGIGISAFGSNNVTVSDSSITGNATGVTGNPLSFGNNQLINNTTDGTFGATVAPK